MTQFPDAKQLFTTVTDDGKLVLSVEADNVAEPGEGEIVVQMEAVPINPSDLGLLTAPANMESVRHEDVDGSPALVADVDPAMMRIFAGRKGKKMPAGNEGAGTVVAAGKGAEALMGKKVSIVGGEMYRTHRVMNAMMAVPLPDGAEAREGASLFVNPMTVQGFVNTMRSEGHEALVHTAAASNLGQMLAKLCLKEGIPLVAIVRSPAQKKILTDIGLPEGHVLDSSTDNFFGDLVDALAETGATLGFDAIGGGKMANYILTAMEQAAAKRGAEFSVYGSTVNKQVYIYGRLDTGETILTSGYGLYWGVGGWLLTPHLEQVGMQRMMEMRAFSVEERNGIFASDYTREISLTDMTDPEIAKAYERKATGEKFLVNPALG